MMEAQRLNEEANRRGYSVLFWGKFTSCPWCDREGNVYLVQQVNPEHLHDVMVPRRCGSCTGEWLRQHPVLEACHLRR